MKKGQSSILRDRNRPLSHYMKMVSKEEKDVKRAISMDLFEVVPVRCIRIGLALYCMGENVDKSFHWFTQAVANKLLDMKHRDFHFEGYPLKIHDLEIFSAGHLVGKADELIDAFRRCDYDQEPVPRIKGIMDQYTAMLKKEPIRQKRLQIEDLKKFGQGLVTLPPLFKSVAKQQQKSFSQALGDYLSKYWAKEVRSVDRDDDYIGKWSLLSAAVCQMMGIIPELPEKTKMYIPIDLVCAPRNS